MSGTDATRAALGERISYAQCWEDPRVLQSALEVGPEDDVLSICSAGDNAFALAIAGARTVTCIDLSAPQIALAKLKLVAAQKFDLERFRSFLGVGPIGQRVFLFHELRPFLDEPTRLWWDSHEEWIRSGLLNCGKFERYLSTFRTRVLPFVHRRKTVERLLGMSDLAEQKHFFDTRWNTVPWRSMFRLFFSKTVMQRSGRSPAQFAHVQGPISKAFMARTEHALTTMPVTDNPFVQWILGGAYRSVETSHPYLSAQGHATLGTLADRFTFVHDDLISHLNSCPKGTYSAFNLSDVPEYLSEKETETLLRSCVGASRSGARIAYWNLLVPRHRPEQMSDVLDRNETKAAALIAKDRAFVYGDFQLETVR
jgi:S-adenosylmethionine-diacylglycerol 3-amino-3-carboxypropyl transferase